MLESTGLAATAPTRATIRLSLHAAAHVDIPFSNACDVLDVAGGTTMRFASMPIGKTMTTPFAVAKAAQTTPWLSLICT